MTHNKALTIFALLVFTTLTIYSQDSYDMQDQRHSDTLDTKNKMSTWQMMKYDGLSVYGGVKHVYTSPLRWKGKDWLTFGGVIAGNAILLAVDEPADDVFKKQGDGVPDLIKEAGFRFGKPLLNYGLTTSVYTLGLITKNEKIRRTGVLLIASATAGGLLQTLGKTAVGRARPLEGEGNLSFRFWSNEAGYHSFPSGHAILAFTTAHAFAKQFDNLFVKGGIYALGLVTPVSRLWDGAHWLTDVTLGLVMSVFIVDSVDNYLKKDKRYAFGSKKHKIRWNLRVGVGQIGVVGRF
ncbi:PAP2 superfamily protein [Aquimarina sp. MAR_2010_214]|uniref:phosphatase PAP2 family protein n=1 Tax=Aquimarina sp. MAR_2010_214 TaxID=1250026 RepID=UPI000C6FF447|nr:phosphatase PAP2 family protein [Aquimarina sp. MAR_2010_214]PKV48141.1 PAP2 superfamily protein [Aquimarina sp. MAR_2010_214]